MSAILLAIAIVAGIGLAAGLGLAVAAVVMNVPTDPRVEAVAGALPGVNCGACGYSGCAGYAEAIVNENAPDNLCTPGGNAAAEAIANVMGTTAQAVPDRKALVRCNGTNTHCKRSYEYRGEQTCEAASLLYSGQKQCNYGCLGFGDCAAACPLGAVALREGVAVVDQNKCVGCALCAAACPKGIIVMAETKGRAINRCCSQAAGPVARRQCSSACIGCRLCEKSCPQKAIAVENNLACVNPALCVGCGLCQEKCPTKCLIMS
jgi:electron transport complex protein RnfB